MDFSEEWKSLWPISSVFSAPLLLSAAANSSVSKRPRTEDDDTPNLHAETGPLVFTPNPDKPPSVLFSSPSLSPRLPPPYPSLSFTRFLSASTSFLPPSTACRIAKEFRSDCNSINADESHDSRNYMHAFNSLQLLPCLSGRPSSSVVAFLPTGENCDQVGYLMLRPEESELRVEHDCFNGDVFVANEKLNSRILKLLVTPVVDFDDSFSGRAFPSHSFPVIGYVMACSMYSVFWYAVKTVNRSDGFDVLSVQVDCLGSRLFRSCAVVNSCWSPHLSEECLVLLETGELYLFDITSCLKKPFGSKNCVEGKRLQVLGSIDRKVEKDSCSSWLGCECSWHPRIFIVAHSSAVFLVDARFENYSVSCLLKIEMLSNLQNDGFVALSRDCSDEFRFCVASKNLLFLCDVRQPCRPLLRWAHNIENPGYLTVFKLSELRSNARDDEYKWASEAGSCVLLGSFWDCEFNLFVYGPNTNRNSVISEISKFCNSVYAWSIPSHLSLFSSNCSCGSCLVQEEAFKESLPNWIDWRQKKDIVLGFGILHGDNFVSLSEPETHGGFLLIRLMSSGKLEVQSYHAAGEFPKNCEAHSDEWNFQDNLLYEKDNYNYQVVKRFQYMELPFLVAYLKGNLDEIIVKKVRQIHDGSLDKHGGKEFSQKSGNAATMELRSLPENWEAFKDINLPASLHEIALRSILAGLHLFFSCQSELFPGILEFLSHSEGNLQFPFRMPSSYSTKLSHKVPLDELGDSFVPPQFLLNLRSLCSEKVTSNQSNESPDEELERECCRVKEMANELTGSCMQVDSELQEDLIVSLSDDVDKINDISENTTNLQLRFHEPLFDGGVAGSNVMPCGTSEKKGSTRFVFRKRQDRGCNVDAKMNNLEVVNRDCPLELQFDSSSVIQFGEKELKQFELLKKHDLNFQKGFHLYQEYLSKANLL